jgi:hypothetical protein
MGTGLALASSGYMYRPGSPWLNDDAEPVADGLTLGSGISYPGRESNGSVSPWLIDDGKPAAAGLGLGIGIANASVGRASLAEAARCRAGLSSARMYQHLF